MTETIAPEALEGARAYESLHVGALFAEWAPRMLDTLDLASGDDLLDIACGTGIVARTALARVGDDGSVTGLDLNPAMLAVARELAPSVAWRHGDAGDLPFEAAAFDAAANQFGMMFLADRGAAVREMLRVVRDGGRVAVAVWDALEASPVYPVEVELLQRFAGDDAADALRAPFVLGDPDQLVRLLDDAGAVSVAAVTTIGTARFPSVRSMVEADLRGWLPVMDVHLDETTIERILGAAEQTLSHLVAEDGTLAFDSPAHIVSGRRSSPENVVDL